uniref:Uncharacterized protein n=1 Tax=Ditylenchus dipsaci TaxID=166011 RepID=A0A915EDA9_9BILA
MSSLQPHTNSTLICDLLTEQPCNNSTGECVKKELMCDGILDCASGEDELEEICHFNELYHSNLGRNKKALSPDLKCPDTWFFCKNGLACFEPTAVCDNIADCRDGSDEDYFCHYIKALRIKNLNNFTNNL